MSAAPAVSALGSDSVAEALTRFDPAAAQRNLALRQRAEQFALCQPALALRLILALLAAVALGSAPMARGWRDWLLLAPVALCSALAAMLLWLSVLCALRRVLTACRAGLAWALVVLLGALAALVGWLLALVLGVAAGGHWQAGAVAVCGAALAALQWGWLAQRAAWAQPVQDSARLAELQSRIRPHFLFNALNTALALVQVDPPRCERVLEDLSQLFRAALAEVGSAVSLDDEVDLAQRYLAIEQIRFGKRLRLDWDLDPAAADARLPPLVLQPLVENAVRHGVEPSPAGADVCIRTRARHGMATIEVSNTLPEEPGRPGSGVALDNVRERLRLLHDLAGRLFTEQRDGRFIARIEVPL